MVRFLFPLSFRESTSFHSFSIGQRRWRGARGPSSSLVKERRESGLSSSGSALLEQARETTTVLPQHQGTVS